MHWIIIFVAAYVIYCALPFWAEVILIIINMSIPDPIPFLDEILMVLPAIKKIHMILVIEDAVERHPIIKYLAIAAVIAVAGFIIYFVYILFTQ